MSMQLQVQETDDERKIRLRQQAIKRSLQRPRLWGKSNAPRVNPDRITGQWK